MALSARYDRFSAFVAAQPLIAPALTYGADGVVSGFANVIPRLIVDHFEAAHRRDVDRALELEKKIALMWRTFIGNSWFAGVNGIKTALMLIGIFDSNRLARPFVEYGAKEVAQVREVVHELKLL